MIYISNEKRFFDRIEAIVKHYKTQIMSQASDLAKKPTSPVEPPVE